MDNWCIIIAFIVIELHRGFYEQRSLSLTHTLSHTLLFHDVLSYFGDKHLTNLLPILDLYFTQHSQ